MNLEWRTEFAEKKNEVGESFEDLPTKAPLREKLSSANTTMLLKTSVGVFYEE